VPTPTCFSTKVLFSGSLITMKDCKSNTYFRCWLPSHPQAKAIYNFKNTKEKLCKTNAAIWCNKVIKLRATGT